MKILLTSMGFGNEEIWRAGESLIGKKRQNINLVTIEEAHKMETGDLSWLTEEKQELRDNFKSVTPLPLQDGSLDECRQMIDKADAIYCHGGNTSYLAKVLEDTGFAKILPEILEQKVWIGSSAGSCVLCHKESDWMSTEIFEEKPYADHYLNILPMVVLPHYHGWHKYEKEDVQREAEDSKYPVYAISDQAALKVTGKPGKLTIETIGEDYEVFLGKDFDEAMGKVVDSSKKAVETAAKAVEAIKELSK